MRHSSLGGSLAGIVIGMAVVLVALGFPSSLGSWALGLVGLALTIASLGPFGRAVFGQRDPESRDVTWVPGGGTHGGMGGHVPPYVPYNRDWDPKHREK